MLREGRSDPSGPLELRNNHSGPIAGIRWIFAGDPLGPIGGGWSGPCRQPSYTVAVTFDDLQQSSPRTRIGSAPVSRLTGAVLGLVVGAIYGAVGTVAHQSVFRIGELAIPFALVFALIGALALLLGFRLLFADRLAVLFAALGMVGIIALFSIPSAGGSVLIPQGVTGLVWTVVPVLIATVVIAWPKMPERPIDGPEGHAATVQANQWDRPEA